MCRPPVRPPPRRRPGHHPAFLQLGGTWLDADPPSFGSSIKSRRATFYCTSVGGDRDWNRSHLVGWFGMDGPTIRSSSSNSDKTQRAQSHGSNLIQMYHGKRRVIEVAVRSTYFCKTAVATVSSTGGFYGSAFIVLWPGL